MNDVISVSYSLVPDILIPYPLGENPLKSAISSVTKFSLIFIFKTYDFLSSTSN